MTKDSSNLVWLDMEMTGLNPDHDRVIEMATIVTDKYLNVLAEGPVFAIHQKDSLLNAMDEWNTKQHGQSGLTQRVRESKTTESEAENKTLEFLKDYVSEGESPLCGNSIYQDRRFLYRYMPTLEKFFHYRLIDVSTVKELARRWAPELLEQLKKDSKHLALDDIKDSINELKFYRENFLKIDV